MSVDAAIAAVQAAPWNSTIAGLSSFVDASRGARAQGQGWSLQESANAKLDGDWKLVVQAMRLLQKKVAGQPKVQNFSINRDESEISVKVLDGSKRGSSYWILSRRHPTEPGKGPDSVWLSSIGAPEKSFPDAVAAMGEFVGKVIAVVA